MSKSAIGSLRDALQVLKTHQSIVESARAAMSMAHFVSWRDGGHAVWAARSDVIILQALNAPDEVHPEFVKVKRLQKSVPIMSGSRYLHETINKRAALKAHIDKCAVDGMIGIVESGRDCDCVEYTHPRSAIPANVMAFLKLESDTAKWADGPFCLGIVTPEEAENTEDESRDLALEAYEDGHPHSIVSRFP